MCPNESKNKTARLTQSRNKSLTLHKYQGLIFTLHITVNSVMVVSGLLISHERNMLRCITNIDMRSYVTTSHQNYYIPKRRATV